MTDQENIDFEQWCGSDIAKHLLRDDWMSEQNKACARIIWKAAIKSNDDSVREWSDEFLHLLRQYESGELKITKLESIIKLFSDAAMKVAKITRPAAPYGDGSDFTIPTLAANIMRQALSEAECIRRGK